MQFGDMARVLGITGSGRSGFEIRCCDLAQPGPRGGPSVDYGKRFHELQAGSEVREKVTAAGSVRPGSNNCGLNS